MFNAGIIASAFAPTVPYVDTYVTASDIRQVYGLERLISTYSGSAIRVRRSSDNTEQDIGFVDNVLDTASLASFVGAGSGFIRTWYDQSGNADDLIQTTASSQPRIVNAGVFDGDLVFDGSDDYLINSTNTPITTVQATIFSRIRINKSGTGTIYYALDGGYFVSGENGWAVYYDPRSAAPFTPAYSTVFSNSTVQFTIETMGYTGTPDLSGGMNTLTIHYSDTFFPDFERIFRWVNGASVDEGPMQGTTATPAGLTSDVLSVGSDNTAVVFANMRINALIICANDQTAVRADVEALIT